MNQRQIPRIDWFRVLHELQEKGMPVTAVAKHINVAKSTILGWKQDAEPRHGDGEMLLALWEHVTGRTRTQAARVAPLELRDTEAVNEQDYIAAQHIEITEPPRLVVKPDLIRRPMLTPDGWIVPTS